MKKLLLFLLFPILSFGQVQIGQDIGGEEPNDRSGESVSLSSDGSIIAIGASFNDGNGTNSGHVRIFENQGGGWVQIGEDIDGETSNDVSGRSVSLSSDGTIVAIGSPKHAGWRGHVRIFENQNNNWIQLGGDIDGQQMDDESGYTVKLSSDGSIVAIGAHDDNNDNGVDAGQVRIFENQGDSWVQKGQDIEGEDLFDYSSRSMSFSSDGTIVAIGSVFNDNSNGNTSGHVRIYKYQSDTWVQIGEDINGEYPQDRSSTGLCLSSDGSIIAIGAGYNDENGENSGHVRVYENQGDNWVQIGEDIDGEMEYDQFGSSVSLSSSGLIMAVGARYSDGNGNGSGHVGVYENQGGNWVQIVNNINGEAQDDNSGENISLSSDGLTLAIGSRYNDDNGDNSGHVRVFDLSSVLSTEEVTTTNFSIFPNPSQNIVSISLSNSDILEKASIYNNLGREVLVSTASRIDVSSLAKGVYILEVTTTSGKGTEKLIIN